MKRLSCILLTVCFFLLLIPHAALAKEDEWKYRELEDGTIAITGYFNFDNTNITIPQTIAGKTVSPALPTPEEASSHAQPVGRTASASV